MKICYTMTITTSVPRSKDSGVATADTLNEDLLRSAAGQYVIVTDIEDFDLLDVDTGITVDSVRQIPRQFPPNSNKVHYKQISRADGRPMMYSNYLFYNNNPVGNNYKGWYLGILPTEKELWGTRPEDDAELQGRKPNETDVSAYVRWANEVQNRQMKPGFEIGAFFSNFNHSEIEPKFQSLRKV